jgi:plasmid stabilization system protein ParE
VARLRIRRLARAEIESAFDWYRQRSPRAAERFLAALGRALGTIEKAPLRHAVVRGMLRRVLVRGFPYAVYYKVYPKVVSVVGVIHGHRHPSIWLRRV